MAEGKLTVIYARQSVDKKDSISIETQIEACKKEVSENENVKIYSDKGYTGANTNRPAFKKLLKDIRSGKAGRVIVYKLDRMSRSLLDFAQIVSDMEENGVEFISLNEKFDTSTPIGKAMLNIIMVFAQLERETIQMRVRDNFYERGKKGLFLAGQAPIGYTKAETKINGIKTHKLQIDPTTAPLIRYIFSEYTVPTATIGSIVKEVNAEREKYGLDKPVSNVRIGRILRNPVYCKADVDVYNYLKNKGAVHDSDISEYDGTRGCTIYGERRKKTTSKFTDLCGDHVQLNQHEGLIDADQWLKVQYKMDSNKQVKNTGKGTHSWLSGIIKCGYCGLALTVVNGQRNGKRYINCGGRKQKICYDRKKHITFDEIEEIIEKQLLGYMQNYNYIKVTKQSKNEADKNAVKIQLQKISTEMESVRDAFIFANENMKRSLNVKMDKLAQEQKELSDKLAVLSNTDTTDISDSDILSYTAGWSSLSLDEKKNIARYFIRNIYVTDDEININWHVPLNE